MKLSVDACVKTIPGKFIYSWFAFHNITYDIKKSVKRSYVNGGRTCLKRIMTDENLIQRLRNDYQKFKKSKLSLDSFFGKNFIFVTKVKGFYRIKDKELSRNNLFVWIPSLDSELEFVNYRVSISDLSSINPIKMSIENIPKLYNIYQSFDDIFDLENENNLAIDMFATDGETHWRSPDLPGFKAGKVDLRIKIAVDSEKKTYWIPPMTKSSNQYQCRKFPGKCRYETGHKPNLDRHIKTCIDQTKLVTKKVISNHVI